MARTGRRPALRRCARPAARRSASSQRKARNSWPLLSSWAKRDCTGALRRRLRGQFVAQRGERVFTAAQLEAHGLFDPQGVGDQLFLPFVAFHLARLPGQPQQHNQEQQHQQARAAGSAAASADVAAQHGRTDFSWHKSVTFIAELLLWKTTIAMPDEPAQTGESSFNNNRFTINEETSMKFKSLVVALGAAVTMGAAFAQAPIVIKFSHVVATDTPKGQAAERFKQLAEKPPRAASRSRSIRTASCTRTRKSSKRCSWARCKCWRRRWPSSARWA
jgi:hypothetical protein